MPSQNTTAHRTRKRPNPYAKEIEWAKAILSPFGCTVEEADLNKFEIAKVAGEGVSLVIYPHKTSAGNYHARIRDNSSKDKRRAQLMMRALDHGYGLPKDAADRIRFSCTFSQKNYSSLWDSEADLVAAFAAAKGGAA